MIMKNYRRRRKRKKNNNYDNRIININNNK